MIAGKIFGSRARYSWRVAIVALLLATAALWPLWRQLAGPIDAPLPMPGALPDMAALPLSFEPNAGQTDPSVSFMAHAPGSTLYFTDAEVVIALQTGMATGERGPASLLKAREQRPPPPSEPSVLRLQFIGADADRITSEGSALPGRVNYIRGNDKAKWYTNIATYSSIAYENLYPGIGLHYSGKGSHLKGTYIVSPHSDPSIIKWRYAGAQSTTLDDEGRLRMELRAADGQPVTLTEDAPVAWQEIDGRLMPVDARYQLAGDGTISFLLGAYNPAYPLTIDPTISYSTYLGGTGWDICVGIAVRNGNAYLTGWTNSTDFPRLNPIQPTYRGGAYDVFVTQLSASGSALVYSTYIGGSDWDQAQSIAVDDQGNAYITGQTSSLDFPVVNAFQPTLGGFGNDAFVTKLNPAGSALVYSTYLGGSATDNGYRIVVGADGGVAVTGTTYSSNFPKFNAYQPNLSGSNDAFVTRFTSNGQALIFSTYLGGSSADYGNGIAFDPLTRVYVVGYTFSQDFPVLNAVQPHNAGGSDAFVTRFYAEGQALSYSTYLGGSGQDIQANDVAWVVTADAAGSAYVTGETMSPSFPTRNAFQPGYGGGFQDAFITKFSPKGINMPYSTYLGGTGTDVGEGIAVDSVGQVYVGGSTSSANFPTRNPISDHGRAFMTTLNAAGADLLFSSRFGGTRVTEFGHAMTIDTAGSIYIAGDTESVDFPVVNAFQSFNRGAYDAFVSKISGVVTPTATVLASTPTPSSIPISTNTPPPTDTPSSTSTPSASGTPASTPPSTVTVNPSGTPQATGTPTGNATASATPTAMGTHTPTSTSTPPPTHTPTQVPSQAPTATATYTGIATPTGTVGPPASTATATSVPSLCPLQFTDVPSTNTFYPFVRCLACRGIISGYSDGTFRPNNSITRGQIAKMVSNAAGFNEPVTGQTFEDVPPNNTFYPFIERMSRLGIISGYQCGGEGEPCGAENRPYFRPNNNATRGQISKIVSNAVGFGEPAIGQIFEDVPRANPFYEFIQRLARRGIMSGYPCGGEGEPCGVEERPYFRWGNNATRGQTAKIVSNTFFPNCQAP